MTVGAHGGQKRLPNLVDVSRKRWGELPNLGAGKRTQFLYENLRGF